MPSMDHRKPPTVRFRSYTSGWIRRLRVSRRLLSLAFILVSVAYFVFASPQHTYLDISSASLEHVARQKLSYLFANENPIVSRGLVYDVDGRVRGWDAIHEYEGVEGLSERETIKLKELRATHPIEQLVEQSVRNWEHLLAR